MSADKPLRRRFWVYYGLLCILAPTLAFLLVWWANT